MREYPVAVFSHRRYQPPYRLWFTAYLRDYNPAWDGCCIHRVEAESGAEAKKLAIQAHRARCSHPAPQAE